MAVIVRLDMVGVEGGVRTTNEWRFPQWLAWADRSVLATNSLDHHPRKEYH